MIRFLILFLNLFLSFFVLLGDNILTMSEVSLVVLAGMIVLDYFSKKSLSLFQVWLVGFIFIILSEAILIEPSNKSLEAVKFLLIANNLVVFGYFVPVAFRKNKNRTSTTIQVKDKKWTVYMLIALVLAYFIYALPAAILTYSLGRNAAAGILFEDRNLLLSSFFGGLSFVLPSIIAFYFKEIKKKKSMIIPLLISMPIFVILFLGGSRFPLLFAFGGFLIVYQSNNNGRIVISAKLLVLGLILLGTTYLMMNFRSSGFGSTSSISNVEQADKNMRISKRIASEMSPEGVVDMTALSMTYFESNPHTYGKSILFLTYFWVPRAIWPDKPTMIGHWLIRKYRSGFSEGHSGSFGFTGELFADFGYFSLVFVFFLGMALQWADKFSRYHLLRPLSYQKIIVGMLFSYVFFFVRSPITSTMTFLGILLVYQLVKIILFKKQIINRGVRLTH
ncbi:MAG: O-antigen polymerase [Lutibacter sp.]